MKKRSSKNQIDEHNLPTEPLPDISAVPFPTPAQSSSIPVDRTVPVPFPSYLDPQQPLALYPYAQTPSSDIERYPYPFFPGAPPGAPYGVSPAATAWDPGHTRDQHTRRRTFLPACVGLFFVCVQLLLVVRFVIRLLNFSPNITWIGVITDISENFVLPIRALWLQIPVVGTLLPANVELYTLIAVLVYGMLARLLVSILKVLLNSR